MIRLFAEKSADTEQAKAVAECTKAEIVSEIPQDGVYLKLSSDGLSLVGGDLSIRGDFSSLAKRIKPENLAREFVVKAAKIKNFDGIERIVDATAGMGEDSFLLAAAGFEVTLFEYDKIIAALLRDSLERAKSDKNLSAIASRMTLIEGDSIEGMKRLDFKPDVVLLDPMFPERRKSGLVKKKFQLLHLLESPCSDETRLVEAAITAKPQRIVIKRPLKAEYLGGYKPSYSLSGDAIRYDCIVLPENIEKNRNN